MSYNRNQPHFCLAKLTSTIPFSAGFSDEIWVELLLSQAKMYMRLNLGFFLLRGCGVADDIDKLQKENRRRLEPRFLGCQACHLSCLARRVNLSKVANAPTALLFCGEDLGHCRPVVNSSEVLYMSSSDTPPKGQTLVKAFFKLVLFGQTAPSGAPSSIPTESSSRRRKRLRNHFCTQHSS